MKTVLRSLLFFLIILVPVMIWGILIEPRFIDEVRLDVAIPNLPEAWEGRRIVFMATAGESGYKSAVAIHSDGSSLTPSYSHLHS